MAFSPNPIEQTNLLDWQHCQIRNDLQEEKFSHLLISTTNPTENQHSNFLPSESKEWIDINDLPQSNKASSTNPEDVPVEKKKKVESLPTSEVIVIEDDETEEVPIVIHAILDGKKKKLFETVVSQNGRTLNYPTHFEETPVIIFNDFDEKKVLEDFLQCDHCEFKTKLQDDFRDHLQKIHQGWYDDPKWFKCGHCEFTSTQFSEVLKHSKLIHKIDQKVYHCKCSYYAVKYTDLFDHILANHITDHVSNFQDAVVVDDDDDDENKNWADFEVVEDERFQCEFCSYGTASKNTLTKHIKKKHWSWYNDGRWYMCGFCSYTHEKQEEVAKHTELVHKKDILWFHCKCSYKTIFIPNLVKHVEKHVKIRKEIEEELEKLTEVDKKEDVVVDSDCVKIDNFQCSLCSFKTKQKRDLIRHLRDNHKSWYEDRNWYKCGHCQYTDDTQFMVTKHTKSVHKKNISWYYCKCTYQTLFLSNLKNHIRKNHERHLNLIPCKKCKFTTTHGSGLASHMKSRHPEGYKKTESDPIILVESDDDTSDPENKKSVAKPAFEGPWFRCGKCPHGLENRQAMALHINKWHPEEPHNYFKRSREEPQEFTFDECVQNEAATGGISVYKCAFCNFRSIVSCSKVMRHIERCHNLVRIVRNK